MFPDKVAFAVCGEAAVQDDRSDYDDDVAWGSNCPEWGALAVTFTLPDTKRDNAALCEFTRPLCGSDFTAPADYLIFRSVPKKWLLARVQPA